MMTEQQIQDLATIVRFLAPTINVDDFITQFIAAYEAGEQNEITIDAAIASTIGIAKGMAEKTPGTKDDQWIASIDTLYQAIKDPETGLIQDLITFIRERRASKKAPDA